MARDFIDTPYYGLTAGKGNLRIAPTDANHIHVSLNQLSLYELHKMKGGDGFTWEPLTIRGVELTGSIHVYRQPDGTWAAKPPEHIGGKAVYVSRHGDFKDASEALTRDAAAIVGKAVTEWVQANPDALLLAERARINNEIRSKESKLDELNKQVETLRGELAKLEADESALG